MRKIIYCPNCLKSGRTKKLFETDENTRGTVFCWCKGCKTEQRIVIKEVGECSTDGRQYIRTKQK